MAGLRRRSRDLPSRRLRRPLGEQVAPQLAARRGEVTAAVAVAGAAAAAAPASVLTSSSSSTLSVSTGLSLALRLD